MWDITTKINDFYRLKSVYSKKYRKHFKKKKKRKKPTTAEIIDQIFRDEIFKILLNSLNDFKKKKE